MPTLTYPNLVEGIGCILETSLQGELTSLGLTISAAAKSWRPTPRLDRQGTAMVVMCPRRQSSGRDNQLLAVMVLLLRSAPGRFQQLGQIRISRPRRWKRYPLNGQHSIQIPYPHRFDYHRQALPRDSRFKTFGFPSSTNNFGPSAVPQNLVFSFRLPQINAGTWASVKDHPFSRQELSLPSSAILGPKLHAVAHRFYSPLACGPESIPTGRCTSPQKQTGPAAAPRLAAETLHRSCPIVAGGFRQSSVLPSGRTLPALHQPWSSTTAQSSPESQTLGR